MKSNEMSVITLVLPTQLAESMKSSFERGSSNAMSAYNADTQVVSVDTLNAAEERILSAARELGAAVADGGALGRQAYAQLCLKRMTADVDWRVH